jgi:hypothetical protein
MTFIIGSTKEVPAKMPLYEGGPVVDTTQTVVVSKWRIQANSRACFKRSTRKALQSLGLQLWQKSTCYRCNGAKIFKCWSHVWGGRCFKCAANGYTLKLLIGDIKPSLHKIEQP